jgi:membrane protein
MKRIRYWLFEKVLRRVENTIHRVRKGETPAEERTNFVQVAAALLLGIASGWQRYKGPTASSRNSIAANGSTIAPTRALVPASQTPQALLSGAKPHKQPLATKKRFSLRPGTIFGLLRNTFKEWTEDRAPQLAAALAYYTVFSIAPLLIIVIAIAALVFGREAAQGQIVNQIGGLIGTDGAAFIESMVEGANKPAEGALATVLSVLALVGGAIGLVSQLKAALNTIWNAKPAPGPGGVKGVFHFIRQNLISFGLVLGVGFMLLVSLVLSAAMAAVGTLYSSLIPGWAFEIINFVISFAVITFLFAAIYKVLPDVDIAWRDVWIGAIVTSLLFTIGKWALGMYLGRSGVTSTYGAAGSLVLILLWIYYSAQILFFGAELTQVYANQYGSRIISDAERAAQASHDSQSDKPSGQSGKTGDRRAA